MAPISLSISHPDLAGEWHPTLNEAFRSSDVSAGSSRKVWWACATGHEWADSANHRTSRGSGCPICAGKKVLAGFNDLASLRPDIAAEWHPESNAPLVPTEVTPGSGKKVWWRDALGHEWQATIANRNQGTGVRTAAIAGCCQASTISRRDARM